MMLYLLIKRGLRALQLSEERFRLLFEQANDAILVVDDHITQPTSSTYPRR